MKSLNVIALLLVIVGGLNWLLFGLFQWDLVGGLFGGMDSAVARIVYRWLQAEITPDVECG